eukprot:756125-Hanusia_phi.AAC.1
MDLDLDVKGSGTKGLSTPLLCIPSVPPPPHLLTFSSKLARPADKTFAQITPTHVFRTQRGDDNPVPLRPIFGPYNLRMKDPEMHPRGSTSR